MEPAEQGARAGFWAGLAPDLERRPASSPAGFLPSTREGEVFAAVVAASARGGGVRFARGPRLVDPEESRDLLPRAEDGGFAGYDRRLRAQRGLATYTLQVNNLEEHGWPVWRFGRDFLRELFGALGFFGLGGYMSCFFGEYPRTPFGVHLDAESVFSFPLLGQKRIRTWPDAYVREHPELRGRTDYGPWLAGSTLIQAEPGGVLYWPADHWHVAESTGGLTLSLGLGVYRADYPPPFARELFADVWRGMLVDFPEASLPEREIVPCPPGELGALAREVPRALRVARQVAEARLSDEQLGQTWIRLLSAGTLLSPAPPRAALAIGVEQGLAAPDASPILARRGLGLYVAANGHGLALPEDPALLRLIERLNGGEAVRATDAGRAAGGALELLRMLYRARAVDLIDEPGGGAREVA